MQTTVNVLLYKSKTLSNGEHPLMIRISKDNKKKYKSLGISLDAKYWDFEKNQPKRNCPNKDEINTLISRKIEEYSKQVIEYKSKDIHFTATSLMESIDSKLNLKTVDDLFQMQIEQLKKENRIRYAESFTCVYKSLLDFNGHLEIYFSDIDIIWLKRYEGWLRSKRLAENTIGIRFRTLRVWTC